jgi:tetratricopeptide (TPR) repeat protein
LLLAAFVAASATSDEDPIARAHRGFQAGEYARTAERLQEEIRVAPHDARLHYWLARCRYELGEFEAAIAAAERALGRDHGRSEYHQWLGRALGGRAEQVSRLSAFGLAKRVGREFEAAVRLDPHNLRAQRDLIEFYARAPGLVGGGRDKAWRQVEALAAIDPVEGCLARAQLWIVQRRPESAEAEYQAALRARPAAIGAYLEAADFYEQRGDGVRLGELAEAAARIDSSAPQVTYDRGVAAALGGRDDEAERQLRSFLDDFPPRSDLPSRAAAREWLGRLYERRGRLDAAEHEYRAALELEPRRKSLEAEIKRTQILRHRRSDGPP